MKKISLHLDATQVWYGYFFLLCTASYNIISKDSVQTWQHIMAYSLVSFAIFLLFWIISLIKKKASHASYPTIGWKEVLLFTAASFGAPLIMYLFDGVRGYWSFSIFMQTLLSVSMVLGRVRSVSTSTGRESEVGS